MLVAIEEGTSGDTTGWAILNLQQEVTDNTAKTGEEKRSETGE